MILTSHSFPGQIQSPWDGSRYVTALTTILGIDGLKLIRVVLGVSFRYATLLNNNDMAMSNPI